MKKYSLFILLQLAIFVFTADPLGAEAIKLQLRWHHGFQFAGYYMAKEKRFYRDEGLDVSFIEGGPKIDQYDAVESGQAQFGVSGSELIIESIKGRPFRSIAVIFQHSPYALMVREGSGYDNPQQLAGRKIYMALIPRTAEVQAMLMREGVNLNQLQIVDALKVKPNFDDPGIDAFSVYATNEPYLMAEKGIPVRLIRPITYGIDFYGDCLFASDDFIRQKPEVVEAFKKASLRGWEYAFRHKQETIGIIWNRYNTENRSKRHLAFECEKMAELILPAHIPLGQQNPYRWERIAETYASLGMTSGQRDGAGIVYDLQRERAKQVEMNNRRMLLVLGTVLIFSALLYLWNLTLKRQVTLKTRSLNNEISEHRDTRDKLAHTLTKYQTLFSAFPHGITVSDGSGKILETNAAAVEILGVGKDEHESRSIEDAQWRILRPDGSDMPPEEFASVIALKENRRVSNREMGVVKSDDAVRWLNVTAAPLPLAGYGVVVTYNDITEKMETEASLRLHRIIVSSASEPMAVIDAEYRFLLVNPAYERFWGTRRDEIIGKRVPDILGIEKFEATVKEKVDRCLAGETVRYGAWFQTPLKGSRFMELNYYPHKTVSGKIIGLINIAYDLTERVAAEDLIRQKEQMLSRTESIAHIGSWQWEVATDSVTWSEELFRIFKRDPRSDAPSFAEHPQLYPPEDMAELKRLVERAVTQDEPYEMELRAVRTDGDIRYCHARGYPEKDGTGKVVRLYGFLQDNTERHETLQELKKLAYDQTTILNNVPTYIYFKDQHNNIIRISESVAQITGLPKEQIEGRHSSEIYPELAEQYWADDLEVIRSGEAKTGILEPLPVADGRTRWLLTDKIPYRDDQGEVAGVIVMATDITDRIEAENRLKESEIKFRSLFKHAPDAIYMVSEHGDILDVNEAAQIQTGYGRDELLSMHVGDLDHRATEEMDRDTIWKRIRLGETIVLSTRHIRRDGGTFPVEIHITLIELNSEPVMLGFVRDVTEKETMLENLRRSEERLSLAFQGANDGLWDWDMETDEVFYSPRWKSMLGYADHEIKNHFSEWERLIKPEDRRKAWSILNEYLSGKRENFTCEFQMRHKNGGMVDILSRAFAIRRESDNKPIRVVGTHVDITERKQMALRLQQAQKMESIGNLAGGIAHDFNNILTPIIGLSELLLEDLPAGSLERENAEGIFKAGKRGGDLVRQILTFSRQSEHKMVPTRIQSILKEVLKLARSTVPSYIELESDIQRECGLVMADPIKIHQVAMNIITNAYHAVEVEGGKILVQLKQVLPDRSDLPDTDLEPGNYAMLPVSDTGEGIPDAVIDKIFDPYFTTKAQGKGTGLGLSVVYGIVREHRGHIRVESRKGTGTTFHVYLPTMSSQPSAEPAQTPHAYERGKERILLVDDEKAIAKLEKMLLERLGYTVTMCIDSIVALETFRGSPESFDLVISDMAMPHMTGVQLAGKLQSVRADIPIILCTGFNERIGEAEANSLGISGFLMKPIVRSDLADLVRKVLEAAKTSTTAP